MSEEQMFNQMKLMKKVVSFMEEERILSTRRASRLKKDITGWWIIKSRQVDKMRERLKSHKGE